MKPNTRPQNPRFASGPCAKHKAWQFTDLEGALIGRSHRSKAAIHKIEQVTVYTRQVLGIPDSYYVALISGSATGAMECLLWNFLGNRPVDVFAWDVFGQRWADDITQELKIEQVTVFQQGTTLAESRFNHDLVFTWNATTSGTCVPQNIKLPLCEDRLVLCDATSAVFAIPLPWKMLDATAFSWQKGLGGEAGQGVIVLSPKAMKDLNTYKPFWPIPYSFKLSQDLHMKTQFFQGQTLNTPSMLLLEDTYQALKWAQGMDGISGLYRRTLKNFQIIKAWVGNTPWIEFLEPRPEYQSPTSVCLKFKDEVNWEWIYKFCDLIAQEEAGFDLKNHRRASPSLRIWAGPTVEKENIEALLPWLNWSYNDLK